MSVKVKGLREVNDYFDKISKVGEEPVKRALNKAGEEVRRIEIDVAQRTHCKYSEKIGYNELKKYPIRIGKMGSKYVSVGIRAKAPTGKQKAKEQKAKANGVARATYWDRVKGLWYNNYGFYHNRTGKYITGSNWIDNAYEESVDKAFETIKDELMKGLK